MYRVLISCCCLLLISNTGQADTKAYRWVDHQDNVHFSQKRPRNKHLIVQKIIIKTDEREGVSLKELINSTNAITQSNAERSATNDKIQQEADAEKLTQERCDTSKKNLSKLGYGGNRLYKDADGNYSRFSVEDKDRQREKLNAFINENCR